MVLRSSFLTCKQQVKPGESQLQNLEALVEAAKSIWTRMKKGKVKIGGKERPMSGEVAMLFREDMQSSTEKVLRRSYLNTTSTADVIVFVAKYIEMSVSVSAWRE